MKIGFIGLGKMGSGMARNLLRAGHELAVYNRSREKAEALSPEGARIANSPKEVCRRSEAVITMLSDDHAVAEIVFGADGIASAMESRCVHISSSTISVACARRLTAEHSGKRQEFVSAPVFGRPEAAESKKLIVVTRERLRVLKRAVLCSTL
jgi:3-hydroxyisobutyrate dehydrogenase-like beta-hydroxyacid dehydrogenase